MHEAVAALVSGDRDVDLRMWRAWWNQLDCGRTTQADAVALLTSLSAEMPGQPTLEAFLLSLAERRLEPPPPLPGTVNIVGTGGGPATFNISTAAALVAATIGAKVIKTGSRAYTSRHGSIDLLDRLGIRPTTTPATTLASLRRHGVAFAGSYVYPRELASLARALFPVSLRSVGRFLNVIGPFLADVPVTAQVTGVSDRSLLPALRSLAENPSTRLIWLLTNDHGADELLSFADNTIHSNDGEPDHHVGRTSLNLPPGDLAELAPMDHDDDLVSHFTSVVSGSAGETVTQTVCLNAAAAAMAAGRARSWSTAMADARAAMQDGAVRRLVEDLRASSDTRAVLTRG